VRDVFDPATRTSLLAEFAPEELGGAHYDDSCGRLTVTDRTSPLLRACLEELVPLARGTFASETLAPTYAFFARYDAATSHLARHKDTNACTYTLDYCLAQRTPWDLWVIDQPYALRENEAIAFYGTAQDHWRGTLSDPETNRVSMIFFHFVEPDHWWFSRGEKYRNTVEHLHSLARRLPHPEHRVFAALLARAATPDEFYRSVAERFVTDDPVAKVFAWVDELCSPDAPPGIALNRTMRRVARAIVDRVPHERIAASLNESRRVPVTSEDVRRAEADLRSSALSMLFP